MIISRPLKILAAISLGAVFLRFLALGQTPFFGDSAWFYFSARDALFTGQFPLLSLPTSITWLHQGPLWTYLLIPALILGNFHPMAGNFLMIFFSLIALPLIYYAGAKLFNRHCGLITAFLYAFFHFAVIHSRIAYHTSPQPLFFLLFLLHLILRKEFLSGLFLGLLYQLHLLNIVIWPFAFWFLWRHNHHLWPFLFGLLLGILPFFLSGPIQTFGVLWWFARLVIGGVKASTFSVSYQTVFLLPSILFAAKLLSFLKPRVLAIFGTVFIFINFLLLWLAPEPQTSHQAIASVSRFILSSSQTADPQIQVTGGAKGVTTYSAPYDYYIWWLNRHGVSPSGKFTQFQIDLSDQIQVQVIQ